MLSPQEHQEFVKLTSTLEPTYDEERMLRASADGVLHAACHDYLGAMVQELFGDKSTAEGEDVASAVHQLDQAKREIMERYMLTGEQFEAVFNFCCQDIQRRKLGDD